MSGLNFQKLNWYKRKTDTSRLILPIKKITPKQLSFYKKHGWVYEGVSSKAAFNRINTWINNRNTDRGLN